MNLLHEVIRLRNCRRTFQQHKFIFLQAMQEKQNPKYTENETVASSLLQIPVDEVQIANTW